MLFLGNDNGAMPPDAERQVTHFARTTFRNEGRLFGIRRGDRRAHMYATGRPGPGSPLFSRP